MLVDELDTLLNVLDQRMNEYSHKSDNESNFEIARYNSGVAHGLSIAIYALGYLVNSWKEKTPVDWRDNVKLVIHKQALTNAINDLHATKQRMKVYDACGLRKQFSDYEIGVEIDKLNDIANRLKDL